MFCLKPAFQWMAMPNCGEGAQLTPEAWIIQIAMLFSYLCFLLKWDNTEGRDCVAQLLEQCTSTRVSDSVFSKVLIFYLPMCVVHSIVYTICIVVNGIACMF